MRTIFNFGKTFARKKLKDDPATEGKKLLERTLKGRLSIGSLEWFAHRPKKKHQYA